MHNTVSRRLVINTADKRIEGFGCEMSNWGVPVPDALFNYLSKEQFPVAQFCNCWDDFDKRAISGSECEKAQSLSQLNANITEDLEALPANIFLKCSPGGSSDMDLTVKHGGEKNSLDQ
mmetsp:Transcript_32350/g.100096  ORF Transcript_32350/g.100096 Transcript_32350/m.100096 type:complete len:119 (+) Transcript_32350:2263-2619(+)